MREVRLHDLPIAPRANVRSVNGNTGRRSTAIFVLIMAIHDIVGINGSVASAKFDAAVAAAYLCHEAGTRGEPNRSRNVPRRSG